MVSKANKRSTTPATVQAEMQTSSTVDGLPSARSNRLNWELLVVVAPPILTVVAYMWAFSYERGFLKAYHALNGVTESYIAVSWTQFMPVLAIFSYIALGLIVTLVYGHLGTALLWETIRKKETRNFWQIIFVLVLCSLPLKFALDRWGGRLPDSTREVLGGNSFFAHAYLGLVVVGFIMFVDMLGVLIFKLYQLITARMSLFLRRVTVAAVLGTMLMAVPWLGTVAGYSTASQRDTYQVVKYKGARYAVLRRYEDISIIRSIEPVGRSQTRPTYAVTQDMLEGPMATTPQTILHLQ